MENKKECILKKGIPAKGSETSLQKQNNVTPPPPRIASSIVNQISKTPPQNTNKGFSLISTLIAVVIIGIISSAIGSLLNAQNRESLYIRQQMASMSTKYLLLQTLSKSGICSCQFDTKKILSSTTSIDLIKFHSGCDQSATDDIIAEKGESIRGVAGMMVSDVKFDKITSTKPNEYLGFLTIEYEQEKLVRAIRPIAIPLVMHTNASGDITSCWGEEDYSCYSVDVDDGKGRTLIGCGETSILGEDSFGAITSSEQTTAIGFDAGKNSTGRQNTFIGYKAGAGTNGENNVILGHGAKLGGVGSNNFIVGYSANTDWLKGNMTSSELHINGELIIIEEKLVNDLKILQDDLENQIADLQGQIDDRAFITHSHAPSHSHPGGARRGTQCWWRSWYRTGNIREHGCRPRDQPRRWDRAWTLEGTRHESASTTPSTPQTVPLCGGSHSHSISSNGGPDDHSHSSTSSGSSIS